MSKLEELREEIELNIIRNGACEKEDIKKLLAIVKIQTEALQNIGDCHDRECEGGQACPSVIATEAITKSESICR